MNLKIIIINLLILKQLNHESFNEVLWLQYVGSNFVFWRNRAQVKGTWAGWKPGAEEEEGDPVILASAQMFKDFI